MVSDGGMEWIRACGCFHGIGNFDIGYLRGDWDAGMDSLMMAIAVWNG